MYVDLYLSKQSTQLSDFKLLGINALHVAMKMEEVELVALGRIANQSEIKKITEIEKKMLKVLNYRILPDTLNFWLESVMKFWDHFALNKRPSALPLFFKKAIHWEADNKMVLNPISLNSNNMFRRAMQVLDLMSLHFGMHKFKRTSLALAVVVIELMQELDIVDLSPGQPIGLL